MSSRPSPDDIRDETLSTLRREFTVMPRFAYHQPLDYLADTFPAVFDPIESRDGRLPVPGPNDRMGYSPHNTDEYLETGKYDHDLVLGIVDEHHRAEASGDFRLLDFGCSSGRVLRHFDAERQARGWRLHGVDIQAKPIQWLREHFPREFEVSTVSAMPHLPYEDASMDVIYGISVFTHIKYLWDQWLLELRRVLKPGGLLVQTIHTENAWRFYFDNQHLDWVKNNHSPRMLQTRDMPVPYFYFGDIAVSQVFWTADTVRSYWSRYLDVLEVRPPPPRFSFQDWVICRKSRPHA